MGSLMMKQLKYDFSIILHKTNSNTINRIKNWEFIVEKKFILSKNFVKQSNEKWKKII
jgi:hypothetical protein